MTGWCPVHDHVYQARGDRCPDCGTALVAVGERDRPQPHEEVVTVEAEAPAPGPPPFEAPPRNAWIGRGLVALGMVGAFLLGLVFPRTSAEDQPQQAPREVSLSATVGRVAVADGVKVRLDRVVQRGRRLSAQFTLLEGAPDPRVLSGLSLEVIAGGGTDDESTFGIGDLELRTSASGFSISGDLQSSDLPVTRLRIGSLEVALQVIPAWVVDLSGIWPVGSADEPRILRVRQNRSVEGRTVTLAAVLAWRDRLEAVFDLSGLRRDEGRKYELGGVELVVPGRPGRIIGGTELRISPPQLIARFENVPRNARRVTIRSNGFIVFLGGPWTWDLE